MRSSGVIAFSLGLILILAGILWGSFVAGPPYPDPSAAQLARYQMHIQIAETLLLTGGCLSFVIAPILRVIRRWRQQNNMSQ